MDFSHTADYHRLEVALSDRTRSLFSLEAEIITFKPKPLSDFAAMAAAMKTNFRKLNPDMSEDSLNNFVDSQVELEASEKIQFNVAFSDRLVSEGAQITLLSHALCEALINAIIAIGLSSSKKEDIFSLVEKSEIKEKWLKGPKIFHTEYNFPKGDLLYETLSTLTRRRNNLVHHKITLESEGKTLIKGSKEAILTFSDEIKLLKRFCHLPYDLQKFAALQIKGPPISGILHDAWTRATPIT